MFANQHAELRKFKGECLWFNNFNINISVANKKEAKKITILKHAIAYYYPI